jgi:hypothetical protein
MPERKTIKKAQAAKRQGKSPSTQAGAFVHEAIDHIKKGKHGAKNTKQAIAIGLSEARRAGVAIPDKSKKSTNTKTPKSGKIEAKPVSPTRSKAATKRLQKEPTSTVSHAALSHQAKSAAQSRTAESRHKSAMKAARTRARHSH